MDFKNAVKALQIGKKEGKKFRLSTEFGKNPEEEFPFPEYPRPQMRRENWTNLNGWWEYAFTETQKMPKQRDGKILVPFSPECDASGVKRQLLPKEYLWYFRTIQLPKIPAGKRLLLQFGAVDQDAVIYCNGKRAGGHLGGDLSFSVDLTPYLKTGENELAVKVRDETDTDWKGRGKQSLTPSGMFYTAQSGIWQTVWMEWIPATHIEHITIEPDFDRQEVFIEVDTALCDALPMLRICVMTPDAKQVLFRQSLTPKSNLADVHRHHAQSQSYDFTISIPDELFFPWTPEAPALYPVTVTLGRDEVKTYFALRTYTIELSEDKPVFCLNHKPCFLMGVLDQGYWSDGLMTAPCDEAFVYDINLAKGLGFNMLRKHIKIESLRWYYHCDRLGMIVWQDMVSGGSTYHMPWVCYMPTLFPHMSAHTKDNHYELFSRSSEEGRKSWEQECLDTIDHLYNVPSIAVWVPFNEGWGQFDAARIAKMVAKKDPTRPVDHASGWFDQKGGDFRSIHNYFRPLQVKLDGKRAFVISEYGGYACHIAGHSSVNRVYGYQKYDTPEEMAAALKQLFSRQLFPLISKGLSGAVYTQLSDVEEEVNGLVTYDRRVVKLPVGHPFAAPSSFAAPYSHGNKPE